MSDMSAGGTATPGGTARPEGTTRARRTTGSAWAMGGMIFAAALLLMSGIWEILLGIAAIARGSFFVKAPNYLYNVDVTAWGWVHLALGALMALTGFSLFTGATWARAVGICLAVLSAIANFFFLPYYPIWSIVIIGLDVFVIWALATARRIDDPTTW
jgi:hypothetical protein